MGTPVVLTEGSAEPGHPPAVGRAGAVTAWAWLTVVVLARFYRALFLVLAATAVLPLVWGWSSYLVRSGSMEPVITAGDVVVAKPFGAGDRVPLGRVMLFDPPGARPGTDPTIHRVIEDRGDGTFLTAGDANDSFDARPLTHDDFTARALILVPLVGLPHHWAGSGHLWASVLAALVTCAAFLVPVLGRLRHGPPPRGARRRPRGRGRRGRKPLPVGVWTSPALVAIAMVVALTMIGVATISAGYTSRTSTRPNAWTVSKTARQPYTAAVLTDRPYVFYRLDEAGGTLINDASGNKIPGTYTSIAAYRQPGSLPRNFGYAVRLNGSTSGLVGGGAATSNPTTYTVELWFRTTTRAGGKLFGFESTRAATSPTYDRHLFMQPDGRLVYGGWSATPKTLTTPAPYNDGAWHHLVMTSAVRTAGQTTMLYVDGVKVAEGVTTATQSYGGWWRVGYGTLPTGQGYPTNTFFAGEVDNIAGYWSELGAARVSAHYAAR